MSDREALNATFFAFRKRERGGVLLGASIAYALIAIVIFGVFAWLNWQGFADYMSWVTSISQTAGQGETNDPEAFAAAMTPPQSVISLLPAYFLLMVFSYLLLAAWEAACLRWMVRGETKGLFGLALDGDTLRVYLGYWLWLILGVVAYILTLVATFGIIGAAAMGGAQDNMGGAGLTAFVLILAVLAVLIYFGVRFAPAAATSIAKRRFAFFDAWTVTKGRFWALLGAFALLFLMFFVAAIVLSIVVGMAMGMSMIGQMATMEGPPKTEDVFAAFTSPSVWIPVAAIYAVMIFGSFMFYVALFGVNARAAQLALQEGKITPKEA